MAGKVHIIIYLIIGGLFLLVDQLCKYFARVNPDYTYYILKPWLGWEYLANKGVAFSLPIPNILMLIATPLILSGLIILLVKKKNKTDLFYLATFLIFAGAISNFIDRALFSITIDYLRLLTSVINLADVMIVIGAGLLILGECREKRDKEDIGRIK